MWNHPEEWRLAVTLAAIAVAAACIVIAARDDVAFLIPVLLVCSAGALLLKYVPLVAGAPPFAAMVASLPSGSPSDYLFPAMLFGILGVLRHFKVLPGGWSEQ